MPRYYPIYLDIRDKKCVVVGGGDVAYRKAVSLKEAGAQVVVISPDFSKDFLKEEGITMLRQKYEERCLEGATLIIAATNDKEINQRVWEEARRHGLLVNVVDQPELCNFIVPSVVNRGELQISISTGGASPAVAKSIREKLEDVFGSEYEEYLNLLTKMRSIAMSDIKNSAKRRKVLRRLAEKDILDIVKNNGVTEAEARMREIMFE